MKTAARITKWSGIGTMVMVLLAGFSMGTIWFFDQFTDETTGLAKFETLLKVAQVVMIFSLVLTVVFFLIFIMGRIAREAQSKSEG